jgi:hypothetical protein
LLLDSPKRLTFGGDLLEELAEVRVAFNFQLLGSFSAVEEAWPLVAQNRSVLFLSRQSANDTVHNETPFPI